MDNLQVVKLNRPKVLNVLRSKTLAELNTVLEKAAGDPQIKGLIVTGVGDKAFSAGGDIKEMVRMTSKEATVFGRLAHSVLEKIETLNKPVVSAVNGVALGAGCDLAIACDLSYASERASFGEPTTSVGILTPFGGTQRLPKLIGPKRTKYLFFTGETFDANMAFQIGLINKVVKHENLLKETKSAMFKILNQAPIAVHFSKALVNASLNISLEEGDKLEIKYYAKCFNTSDQKEGMKAFIEKRKPRFTGE